MNIVIIGGGAIGLLFYQAFHRNADKNSINLSLMTRKKIKQFSFTNTEGLSYQIKINAAQAENLNNADIILVCVKSYQVDDFLVKNKANLSSQVKIILCHNGMGSLADTQLSTLKNEFHLYTLLTTHGSKKFSAHHIIHTGLGFCELGSRNHHEATKQHQALTELFKNISLNVSWQCSILKKQWLKLAINSVINPLTAINNIPNGDISNETYRKTIKKILHEFIAVANTQNIQFSYEELLKIVLDVSVKTAKNRSSMLSDIENNQKTEIDYINGYIVRMAHEYNIKTPENKKLCQEVNQLTKLYLN